MLGPILFSIYINDLVEKLVALDNGIQPMLLADDIALVPRISDDCLEDVLRRLQQSLGVCSVWARENFMTFSKDKSNLLCFRRTRHLDPFTSDALSHLTLESFASEPFKLKVVDSYKYLGIKFNAYVRQLFTSHWEDLIHAVEFRVHQVCRTIDKETPIMVGIQLVTSIVRSKIGYSLSHSSTLRRKASTLDCKRSLPSR